MKLTYLVYTVLVAAGSLALAKTPSGVQKATGWEYGQIPAGSAVAAFANGAEAVLMFGTNPQEGSKITIYMHPAPIRNVSKLGQDPQAWRKTLFSGPATRPINVHKDTEKVIQVGGQLRYLLEFDSFTETSSNLNTSLMATVINGQLHYLLYEEGPGDFWKNRAAVHDLFTQMEFSTN